MQSAVMATPVATPANEQAMDVELVAVASPESAARPGKSGMGRREVLILGLGLGLGLGAVVLVVLIGWLVVKIFAK